MAAGGSAPTRRKEPGVYASEKRLALEGGADNAGLPLSGFREPETKRAMALAFGAILSMFWAARDAGGTSGLKRAARWDRLKPAIIRHMREAPEALAPGARIFRTQFAQVYLSRAAGHVGVRSSAGSQRVHGIALAGVPAAPRLHLTKTCEFPTAQLKTAGVPALTPKSDCPNRYPAAGALDCPSQRHVALSPPHGGR